MTQTSYHEKATFADVDAFPREEVEMNKSDIILASREAVSDFTLEIWSARTIGLLLLHSRLTLS